jgi:Flp pilus assembly secretin CpaC
MLAGPGARLMLQTRGTPDGALAAAVSDQSVCAVQIVPGVGAARSIAIIAKAPGVATVRVTDARGETRTIMVRVIGPPAARSMPHIPGGPH